MPLEEEITYEVLAGGTLAIGTDEPKTKVPLQVAYTSRDIPNTTPAKTTTLFRASLPQGETAQANAQSLIDASFEFLKAIAPNNTELAQKPTPELPGPLKQLLVLFDAFELEGDRVTNTSDATAARDPESHVQLVHVRGRVMSADGSDTSNTWTVLPGVELSKLSVELLYNSILKETGPPPIVPYRVIAPHGMYIRATEPDNTGKHGRVLGTVRKNTIVKSHTNQTGKESTYRGITAKWHRVTWNKSENVTITGYMWGGYLRRDQMSVDNE